MRLYAVCAADYQNGRVENSQNAFRFGGKIAVSRRIHQHEIGRTVMKQSGLCEDGNAPAAFQRGAVQKTVAMIHAAESPEASGCI